MGTVLQSAQRVHSLRPGAGSRQFLFLRKHLALRSRPWRHRRILRFAQFHATSERRDYSHSLSAGLSRPQAAAHRRSLHRILFFPGKPLRHYRLRFPLLIGFTN
jgi:hypothetical protein